jgi:hypothetical protein
MSEDMLDAGAVTADLHSGDPTRVAQALAALEEVCFPGILKPPLPVPPPECLAAFGSDLTEELAERYLRIVHTYVPMEPPLELHGEHTAAVDAVLIHGPGQPAFEAAMYIRIDDDPDQAVKYVMRHLSHLRPETEPGFAAVEELVQALLDGRTTRAATVAGLADWAFHDDYPTVIRNLSAQLEPAEREQVENARDDS